MGPNATGLAIADTNNDGLPDLVVSNAFGDILVLLSKGDGGFEQPQSTDQGVGLAVGYISGQHGPTVILANQALDHVIVKSGPRLQAQVLGDRGSGVLIPGKPVLADLNGDGLLDVIVPNTGGNNVLVYPGLPGGGFGPALNDGNGFIVGTNPVAVLVADVNRNGRPDLIAVNRGSNDVSILSNDSTTSTIDFTQGPRLSVGSGPVAAAFADLNGDGIPDLLVSDGGSRDLRILPGRSGGFFDDSAAVVIPMTETPGAVYTGAFTGGGSQDIVALDPGTSNVTLVTGASSGSPVLQEFSSGGLDPIAGFTFTSGGFENLVIANNGDGTVALLQGGPDGLTLADVQTDPFGQATSGVAFASLSDNELQFYTSVNGSDDISLLVFFTSGGLSLSGEGSSLSLVLLQPASLPLIATLLNSEFSSNGFEEESGAAAENVISLLAASSGPGALDRAFVTASSTPKIS